ncbi:MAG: ribonuclease III [candidate division NC10 bacterium]|nr:ribonuclease III [candidate division NC10 bacterium]
MQALEDLLRYRFRNPDLLHCALTHRSASSDGSGPGPIPDHNERMEFLGDALLGVVVSEFLYQACPAASEGELSSMKARLINRTSLAHLAKAIHLGDFLKLGKGEERSGGRRKTSILAGALEALIAALYLDGGWPALHPFLLPHLYVRIRDLLPPSGLDAKSRLQALVQSRLHLLPQYRVTTRKGPAHEPIFWVEVRAGGRRLAKGQGRNKREAEQEAAQLALRAWEEESEG